MRCQKVKKGEKVIQCKNANAMQKCHKKKSHRSAKENQQN
jgi:hypothetical protein